MNAPRQAANSPFHRGEREMQTRVGKRERMEKIGRTVIRSYMPDQHREFFGNLPFVVLGSVDPQGWPWASILSDRPGFLSAPTETLLRVQAAPVQGDPLSEALKANAPIGVVGVELGTRRRNRMNAQVREVSETGFSLEVLQSFGNCPKYIQTHDVEFVRDPAPGASQVTSERFDTLNDAARDLITSANSFYVASYADTDGERSVDVSHRGGRSGFVKVQGNSLVVPDFLGNNFFSTLGNFLVTPRAGLLFPDYKSGNLLMLTGAVEVLDENHPEIAAFKGAERGWRFDVAHGIYLRDALPFRAALTEYSPNSLNTGDWSETKLQ